MKTRHDKFILWRSINLHVLHIHYQVSRGDSHSPMFVCLFHDRRQLLLGLVTLLTTVILSMLYCKYHYNIKKYFFISFNLSGSV